MNDESDRVSALLHEAGETHHLVYRIVDGDDPDWASWYAQWLLDLSELPQILGTTPVRSELVWMLVSLDKEYTTTTPDVPWPQWYAERIVDTLALRASNSRATPPGAAGGARRCRASSWSAACDGDGPSGGGLYRTCWIEL
jgi:hypothetical protein